MMPRIEKVQKPRLKPPEKLVISSRSKEDDHTMSDLQQASQPHQPQNYPD